MIKQTTTSAAGMKRLRRVLAEATEPLTAVQLGELAHISVGALLFLLEMRTSRR